MGQSGTNGTSGFFSLDAKTFNQSGSPDIGPLDQLLNGAGFDQSRTYRVRTGDVSVTGTATALNYSISADAGSIVVTSTGKIDASGATGGTISLIANGNVTLDGPDANGTGAAMLTVAGQTFNSAGQGGAVTLEAGSA